MQECGDFVTGVRGWITPFPRGKGTARCPVGAYRRGQNAKPRSRTPCSPLPVSALALRKLGPPTGFCLSGPCGLPSVTYPQSLIAFMWQEGMGSERPHGGRRLRKRGGRVRRRAHGVRDAVSDGPIASCHPLATKVLRSGHHGRPPKQVERSRLASGLCPGASGTRLCLCTLSS